MCIYNEMEMQEMVYTDYPAIYVKDNHTGIGTDSPSATLEVNGTFKFTDGNQGSGKVLISDATGEAVWSDKSVVSNTLDEAYDTGGPGAGKNITADAGAVRINGTDGLLVTGTFDSGQDIDNEITGAGTRMFFYPRKAAFRAGYVAGNQWNNSNIGDYSVAMGLSTIASGDESTAMGLWTTASGNVSTAMGVGTTASGDESTAMGHYTTASGHTSTAMGFYTTAKSFAETVIGSNNTDYTPAATDSWDASDRLFVIGNGADYSHLSDALIVYKNGNAKFNYKITAPDSGDNADLKPYIYGYLKGATGTLNIDTDKSSSGFTVGKIITGKYRVLLSNQSVQNYVVTANAVNTNSPLIVTFVINTRSFDLYVWDKDGNHVDADVSFVVYKK